MKVSQLISALEKHPSDAIVMITEDFTNVAIDTVMAVYVDKRGEITDKEEAGATRAVLLD